MAFLLTRIPGIRLLPIYNPHHLPFQYKLLHFFTGASIGKQTRIISSAYYKVVETDTARVCCAEGAVTGVL